MASWTQSADLTPGWAVVPDNAAAGRGSCRGATRPLGRPVSGDVPSPRPSALLLRGIGGLRCRLACLLGCRLGLLLVPALGVVALRHDALLARPVFEQFARCWLRSSCFTVRRRKVPR